MGDMADLYNEYPDEFDDEDQPVTCQRCGTRNLWWHHTGACWHLINNSGNFHVCKNAAKPNEFPDLP